VPTVLIVILAIGLLFVLPLIAVPVLLITSVAWRSGPRWARITLAAGALLFVLYFLVTSPRF
jgi:hypothetical protein